MSPMVVPLYIDDLHVSTVKGVVGMEEEEWKTLYAKLKESLKDVKVPPNMGNKGKTQLNVSPIEAKLQINICQTSNSVQQIQKIVEHHI